MPSFQESLSLALQAAAGRHIHQAQTYFNDALAQATDHRQRIQAFQEFGNAMITAKKNRRLGRTYLLTGLALAVDLRDEELVDALQQDIAHLDKS